MSNSCPLPRSPLAPVLFLLLALAWFHSAAAVEMRWIMDRDPVLRLPDYTVRFPAGMAELWLEAIELPERDIRRRTISAIALAHQRGLPGLEQAVEPLMKVLQEQGQDQTMRLTAARTLVVLEAQQASSLLMRFCVQDDLDMSELIEPALARWKFEPMRAVWMDRLGREQNLRRLDVLAIRGLVAFGETDSLPRLRQLAQQRNRPVELRLEAAQALGAMQETGLEGLATQLVQDKSSRGLIDRMVAARMLASHHSQQTAGLLCELTIDPEPAVQAIALKNLLQIDPNLALTTIESTIKSNDAKVRRLAAESLIANPSQENVVRLASLLADPIPDLRRFVCDALLELADDKSHRESIVILGRALLEGNDWRSQEQAILLLVSLDDKSIADRLLVLIDADREEVHTSAAWGLSRLAVPDTAEPIHRVFQTKTELVLSGQPRQQGTYVQLSHLAQALGILKHTSADPILQKYVPKGTRLHPTTRSASIWALGHLHAAAPDEELANTLTRRMMDVDSITPEEDCVRRMAAVALGRMRATEKLPQLREMLKADSLQGGAGYACAWAIHQITDEPLPEIKPLIFWEDNWFLTPIKPRQK